MKPDWEGIAICLALVAGTYVAFGQRPAGVVAILLALVLARAKMKRGA